MFFAVQVGSRIHQLHLGLLQDPFRGVIHELSLIDLLASHRIPVGSVSHIQGAVAGAVVSELHLLVSSLSDELTRLALLGRIRMTFHMKVGQRTYELAHGGFLSVDLETLGLGFFVHRYFTELRVAFLD